MPKHQKRAKAELRKGKRGTRAPRWCVEEDRIVQGLPLKQACRRLPQRTSDAIIQRRWLLKNPDARMRSGEWTSSDIQLLRSEYPTAKHTRDLVPLFRQKFTLGQIRQKARKLGLHRQFTGNTTLPEGHFDLVDQIRLRAKADGITFTALDRELKCGNYFLAMWRHSKRVNLRHVAKAVSFFGGTLVIDWQDR